MSDSTIEVWGRADSSAVARVMWTLGELGLPCVRHDWGGKFGGNDDPSFRAMQPAGRIPAVRLPGGATLWESNAVIRYLTATHATGGLMPADPIVRARADAWMDWSAAFADAVSGIRSAYRSADATPEAIAAARTRSLPVLHVLEQALDRQDFVMGDTMTMADLSLGVWGHRLHRCPEGARPADLPAVDAWLARLRTRAAYREHVVAHVSARPQTIGMAT